MKRGAVLHTDQTIRYLECERKRTFSLLMMSGGMLGAFTYSVRGNVFCNAQTGNIVLLGMALGNGAFGKAAYYLIPILAYLLGTIVSEILPNFVNKNGIFRWDTLLVGFELLVTLLLGFLPEHAPYQISQIAINFICSMQYNTFRQAEGIPMATTFCTNHIRQTGIFLAKWVQKKDRSFLLRCLQHEKMLLLFLAGAAVSAFLCRFFLGKAVWGVSFLLLLVFSNLLYADLTKEKGMLDQVPKGH